MADLSGERCRESIIESEEAMALHNIERGTYKTLHYLLLGLQVNLQMTKILIFLLLSNLITVDIQ